MPTKLTTQQLEDAIWDYIMEHSDVTHNGTIFVKFHVTTKKKFFGHVISRANGYHRENPDTKYLTALAKQKEHKDKCQEGIAESKIKKSKCVTNLTPEVAELIKEVGAFNRQPRWKKKIIKLWQKYI